MPRPSLASQHGEDHLLLAAFEGEPPGFYIDVGAFDGVHLSNTWVFEQLGWQGYCIEPSPRIFRLLAENRPGARCIEAAAAAGPGELELLIDPTMLLSSVTGDESAVREAFDVAARARELEDDDFVRATVRTISLDDLLRQHAPPPRIDLVSIDVEGAEMQVLDGFDLDYHRPRVLVLEANTEQDRAALVGRCEAAGYRHARALRGNHFFAREDRLLYRLRSTQVHCLLPRNLHPFGLDYTHPDHRQDRLVIGVDSYPLEEVVRRLRVQDEQQSATAGDGDTGADDADAAVEDTAASGGTPAADVGDVERQGEQTT